MKLLIVEDNTALAEITAELLQCLDRPTQLLEAITLVEDLQTAIHCLPEQDAVLCDGMFPLSPGSRFVAEEWDVLRHEANRRGIHFVLYSGSARAIDCARESNTAALAKPATIEEIYATITHGRLPDHSKDYAESALVAENCRLAGGTHVPDL